MDVKLFILEVLILYFLAIFQTAFLPHFNISLNLILAAIVFINILNNPTESRGYESALTGGFFMDIFSKSIFPFSVLVFLIFVFLIKTTLQLLKLNSRRSLFVVFLVAFFILSFLYNFLFGIFI